MVQSMQTSFLSTCPHCRGNMMLDYEEQEFFCIQCGYRAPGGNSQSEQRRPRGRPVQISSEEARILSLFAQHLSVNRVAKITGHGWGTINKICQEGR